MYNTPEDEESGASTVSTMICPGRVEVLEIPR